MLVRAKPEKEGEEAREQRKEGREREASSRASLFTIHHNHEFEPSKDLSANEATSVSQLSPQ